MDVVSVAHLMARFLLGSIISLVMVNEAAKLSSSGLALPYGAKLPDRK